MRLLLSLALVAVQAICGFAQELATVHIEQVKELPYVSCGIADSGPLHCLLDTGSAMTGVSRELAERLHLKTHTDPSIPRADLATQALDDLPLHIGAVSWTAHRVSIVPDDISSLDRESGNGFHTDVVIGTSLFEQFQVTLDPDASQIRFSQPGAPVPEGVEKLTTSVPQVPFAILMLKSQDGHAIAGPFSLDTGSRSPVLLSPSFWTSRPALAISDVHGEQMSLDGLRIGSHTLSHVPAGKPSNGSGLLAAKTVGGVLGAPILNRFLVIYDLSRNSVWIKPGPHLSAAF